MLLQFLDEVFAGLVLPLLAEYDGSLHHHTTDIVGHTGDGTLYDGGMRHQGTLHLKRTDTVAGALDHIVDTAFEPVVAVFIAPGHIAGMIDAVVPGLTGQFLVTIVFLEEADGLTVTDAHHDLTLLTILATGAVGTQQVDVILGVGHTHAAGLRLHPGEGAERHGGLRLSEAFHHLDAGLLVELIEHGGIQGLAGGGAIFQRREVIVRQILADHEAVDSGRCTETRHLVFLNLTQQGVGIELLVVEDEHRCAGEPLTIELTPNGLTPAGVGNGQVEGTFMQVMPEHTRCQMAHGIEVVVGHHLRLATGA